MIQLPREPASDRQHAKDELSVNSVLGSCKCAGAVTMDKDMDKGRVESYSCLPDLLGLPPVLGNDDEWTAASEWTMSMWLVERGGELASMTRASRKFVPCVCVLRRGRRRRMCEMYEMCELCDRGVKEDGKEAGRSIHDAEPMTMGENRQFSIGIVSVVSV